MADDVTLEDHDLGWQMVMSEMAKLDKIEITVGVHQEDGQRPDEHLTNVQIATFHEFGTRHVPERSFLRSTVDEDKGRIFDYAEEEVSAVMSRRRSAAQAGDRVAQLVEGMIKERIDKGIAPALAESTIRKKTTKAGKRGTTPLHDKGHLINAIRGKVRG